MQDAHPSRTAQRVATRRAAHQVLDRPQVFEDPLAIAIAGRDAAVEPASSFSRALRAFIAVRSRYAEDQLAAAVQRGVRQYVVLGARLDTFAYRNPLRSSGLHVFEVDHPATQAWKRARLSEAGIAIPDEMTFTAVDFEAQRAFGARFARSKSETQSLDVRLHEAGFRRTASAFFSWLGVTPYLSRAAFDATIQFIAGMPAGSGVVFDFAVERSLLSPAQQRALDALAERVARAGEPFRLFFDPAALVSELARLGFGQIEDLGSVQIDARYFAGRSDGLAVTGGGHLLSCQVGMNHRATVIFKGENRAAPSMSSRPAISRQAGHLGARIEEP
jgi:methyltransferase (TIGR00027 family)